MTSAASSSQATRPRPGLLRSGVIWAIAIAWLLAIVAEATGRGHLLHHDALAHSHLPLWVVLGLFLLAWQAMIAAMMLPSSLPLIRLFNRVAAGQPRPVPSKLAFLGGYAAVWSVFGVVAMVGDLQLHHLVERWPWLDEHPQVIAGSVLIMAGAFQFSSLKDRCLTVCRSPGPVHHAVLPPRRPCRLEHRRTSWSLLHGVLLGAHARGVRCRCGQPLVDGRAHRRDGVREDRARG